MEPLQQPPDQNQSPLTQALSTLGGSTDSSGQMKLLQGFLKNPNFRDAAERVQAAYHSNGTSLTRIRSREELSQLNSDNKPKAAAFANPDQSVDHNKIHEFLKSLVQNALAILQSHNAMLQGDKNCPQGIKALDEIKVSTSLAKNHPLAGFINKDKPLSTADFISLLKSDFINLKIMDTESDGILLASNGESHGQSAWTRDMAAVALGKIFVNQHQFADKIANALYTAYANPDQYTRINSFINTQKEDRQKWSSQARERWHNNENDIERLPHVKFRVEDGLLKAYKDGWNHRQLDAFGYTLTLLAKLAMAPNQSKFNAKTIDGQFSSNQQSTWVAMSRMLMDLEFWWGQDHDGIRDAGAWEDPEHRQRASSIAACISGLALTRKAFNKAFETNNEEDAPAKVSDNQGYNLQQFKADLDEAIQKATETLLEIRIPKPQDAKQGHYAYEVSDQVNEGGTQYEGRNHKNREFDSALLFILVLSDPEAIGLNIDQQDAILRSVYKNMGEIGFRRYQKDIYMGQNWTTRKHPETKYKEHADNTQENYQAAEWAMFDPYLAFYYYKRFIESKGEDLDSYLRADRHTRRALAQVTKTNFSFYRKAYTDPDKKRAKNLESTHVQTPAGEVLEHHWLNTDGLTHGKHDKHKENPRWIPGENYGLNWTKVAMQEMIVWGALASQAFEKRYQPDTNWDAINVEGLKMAA